MCKCGLYPVHVIFMSRWLIQECLRTRTPFT